MVQEAPEARAGSAGPAALAAASAAGRDAAVVVAVEAADEMAGRPDRDAEACSRSSAWHGLRSSERIGFASMRPKITPTRHSMRVRTISPEAMLLRLDRGRRDTA